MKVLNKLEDDYISGSFTVFHAAPNEAHDIRVLPDRRHQLQFAEKILVVFFQTMV